MSRSSVPGSAMAPDPIQPPLRAALPSWFSVLAAFFGIAAFFSTTATLVAARASLPWRALVRAAIGGLGRILAPDRCAACDQAAPPDATFCDGCAAGVVRAAAREADGGARGEADATREAEATREADGDATREVVACAIYGGAVARALRRFKYGGRPDLAAPLGRLLAIAARELDADLVVPVPLHPRKLRARGYNQAALLAFAVARELAAPLAARGLVRTRDTAAQAGLDRAGRLHNLDGVFRVRVPAGVRGRRVVLVDDVCTTGSTLGACRDALLAAGALTVTALVLARADRDGATHRDAAPGGDRY